MAAKPKKRKAGSNWESELRDAIDNGEPDALREIGKSLSALQRRLLERLTKQVAGTGVCMVDSNQTQGQDVGKNIRSRIVRAKFAAGPKAAPFSICFDSKSVGLDKHVTESACACSY